VIDKVEKVNVSIWVKVKHPYRVTKFQFGYHKTQYWVLDKNTAQLITQLVLKIYKSIIRLT
jgi:IS5 family transposase